MSANDGGNAFPVADYDHQVFQPATGDECKRQLSGMSLRDYLAAKAMQGALSNDELLNLLSDGSGNQAELQRKLAAAAYSQADAMLAVRAE